MSREGFPKSKILTAGALANQMRQSNSNGARFCFVLGSGASVESGIPSGGIMEMRWMNCIMGVKDDDGTPPMDPREMRAEAENLRADGFMKHSFDTLEKAWNQAREHNWRTLPSEYYFDLYKLRFYPDPANGYHYMERLMEGKLPSMGYRVLARLLEEQDYQNNLVITTNFDSLVEDALFFYGDKRPLSADHEALAGYISVNAKRPIVAKVHRGLLLHPFNTPEETDHLSSQWEDALDTALRTYTPIVIGYGGGDGSLMSFLEKNCHLTKLYWCFRSGDWPGERVEALVQQKNGFLVEIDGFDAFMLKLGNQRFPVAVTPTETEKLLHALSKRWADNYQEQYNYNILKENPAAKQAAVRVEQAEERREAAREQENALSAWDYFRRGNRASEDGDYIKAIANYDQAIRLKPDFAEAYYNQGIIRGNQGEHQKAIDGFNEAIRLKPDYAEAYFNRGVAWGKQGKEQQAIADYSVAVQLNPDDEKAYNNRGFAWMEQGEEQRAIADFGEAIRLKPDEAKFYFNRGIAWGKQGEEQQAISDFSEAIRLNPDYVRAYYNRGVAWENQGDYQRAIADFSEAIELKPHYAEAYCTRGSVWEKTGRTSKGDRRFQ